MPSGLPRQWPGCEIRLVSSGGQLAQDAADADVVFLWERVDWLREHWGWSRQLRWVAAPTAGVDWLLFPELIDSDVVLTNAAGLFDEAIAGWRWSPRSARICPRPCGSRPSVNGGTGRRNCFPAAARSFSARAELAARSTGP